MTPVEELCILCPCCGRHLSVLVTEDGIAVRDRMDRVLTEEASERAAAILGIELGILEGGEKIGEGTHSPFRQSG